MANIVQTIGTSYEYIPVEVVYAVLDTVVESDSPIEVYCDLPLIGKWGIVSSRYISETYNEYIPEHLDCIWLSLYERIFYSVNDKISESSKNEAKEFFNYFKDSSVRYVVGFGPKGYVAVWLQNDLRSVLLYWKKGDRTDLVYQKNNLTDKWQERFEAHCCDYLKICKSTQIDDNIFSCSMNNLINRMRQYNLRYMVKEIGVEKENKSCCDFAITKVSVYNSDGSYDKTNNVRLMSFSEKGKPQIISIEYRINKNEYFVHFWLDEEGLAHIFERFYGAHPETKTDFIIRIDADNKKYELALFRQGLKEPVVIPESAYQLIVFKNKFEDYRSENYNQPRGAWIW